MLILLRYAKVAFEQQYKCVLSIIGGSGISSTSTETCGGHLLLQVSHLHWYRNSQFLKRKSCEEEVLGYVSPLLQKENPVELDLLPDS